MSKSSARLEQVDYQRKGHLDHNSIDRLSLPGFRPNRGGDNLEDFRLDQLLASLGPDTPQGKILLGFVVSAFLLTACGGAAGNGTAAPAAARKSTTLDNGRENHLHFGLTDKLEMKTFFADPYASYQRATNENTNGLLRRYLPRGTSFKDLTQTELDDMVWEINNRPRKCLGYNTSQEVFEAQLKAVRF